MNKESKKITKLKYILRIWKIVTEVGIEFSLKHGWPCSSYIRWSGSPTAMISEQETRNKYWKSLDRPIPLKKKKRKILKDISGSKEW